jgi:hypothetical protein
MKPEITTSIIFTENSRETIDTALMEEETLPIALILMTETEVIKAKDGISMVETEASKKTNIVVILVTDKIKMDQI